MSKLSCKNNSSEYCIQTPLCDFTVISCHQGLHALNQWSSLTDENFNPNTKLDVEIKGHYDEIYQPVKELENWLQVYFRSSNEIIHLPLPAMCPLHENKPGFYAAVWRCLSSTVSPGEVITYGELAERLNKPGAARAVGSAMRTNPLCIIVPCHRVVKSSGLGKYHGGTRQKVKQWLLEHEGVKKYI